jgi:hypothetical protein
MKLWVHPDSLERLGVTFEEAQAAARRMFGAELHLYTSAQRHPEAPTLFESTIETTIEVDAQRAVDALNALAAAIPHPGPSEAHRDAQGPQSGPDPTGCAST